MEVYSYYVLWTFALSIAVIWVRRRAVIHYSIDDESARKCLIWAFIGMLVGARLGGYSDHWSYYATNPERILNILEGGLSSTTAFLGAGFLGIFYCKKNRIPVWRIAEAASLPSAATVAIGRIGCFLNGCCYGKVSRSPTAVHFPFDPPGIMRHPTQLYYSAGALIILMVLWFFEKRILAPNGEKRQRAFLWPLFMVLYGGMRSFIDFLRVGDRIFGLRTGQIVGAAVAVSGLIWLLQTLSRDSSDLRSPSIQ
jgi:phosphatidylglycerol:prolipoprotein diacylglycerol transferase